MSRLTLQITTLLLLGCLLITFLSWKENTSFVLFSERLFGPWKAPFPDEKPSSDFPFIPKHFAICLHPGNSVQDVSTAIGRDLQPYVSTVFDDDDLGIIFVIHDAENDLVTAIRTYRGVRLVQRDYGGYIVASAL
ncbi:hypothetical protein F5884DRAFT_757005 [Xylogone sp. PMI_703]|nr:hypothetical protein F5884DRAFT_757005 [Xylogone sp. PMI_703]